MVKYAILNSKGFKKLSNRRLWIYNKEVEDVCASPGDIVKVFYKDRPVALAFANPLSKIVLRIISFSHDLTNINSFIERKIVNAINKRFSFVNTNSVRLFHSDADGLSGLIVDKYGDNIICSFDTAGVDRLKILITSILRDKLNPKGIYEKASEIRKKEGLSINSHTIFGKVDDEFIIKENEFEFMARLKSGQKTGFYLDQRKNRRIVRSLMAKRVLDLFSYSGGFGIHSRADFVKFVEISKRNCDLIKENICLNKMRDYEIVNCNAFDFLSTEDNNYDLIIIDPPAFAKNRHSVKSAVKGYKYLISKSLDLLDENGYLVVFSCSFSIGYRELLEVIVNVSMYKNMELEVIEFLKQDIDHPYMVAVPESLYLTGIVLRKGIRYI